MNNLIVLSPSDPEIQRLTQNPDPELLAMVDRMDMVDAWERLSLLEQMLAALVVIVERGGRMGKTIAILIAVIVAAGMVYLASDRITALAVGLFLGYVLGTYKRKPRR